MLIVRRDVQIHTPNVYNVACSPSFPHKIRKLSAQTNPSSQVILRRTSRAHKAKSNNEDAPAFVSDHIKTVRSPISIASFLLVISAVGDPVPFGFCTAEIGSRPLVNPGTERHRKKPDLIGPLGSILYLFQILCIPLLRKKKSQRRAEEAN